ncbi:MAG: histidine kinase [Lachnospiraceae bacterium]|nr:histidine kinase [Lachnospiraceae bacterium]
MNPDMITFSLLIAEFLSLMIFSKRFVFVHAGPNRIIVLLGFFWSTVQYTIVKLILIRHPHTDTYDGITLLVFAAVTAVLFPVMDKLMSPYAKEYLLIRDRVRPQVKAIVTVMALISLVQVFTVSWRSGQKELPLLALMSVSIMVVYMLLIRYVVVEEQRTRIELQLLTSQIGPHFTRNTLNAICNLIDKDPKAAIRAIYDFSGYLRMNVNAMGRTQPVPFQEELQHVMFYLSIEKLRFREELQIEYDIPVTGFFLPALTVQPMVENAVRHGIRSKKGRGKLLLRTRETEKAYEVVIQDDGVGFQNPFDYEEREVKNRGEHYGLANVRARLNRMVGGRLIVESETGKGTTVTIQIPKSREQAKLQRKEEADESTDC